MKKLNKDVITYIAMKLDYEDIITLCLRDKKFNRYLGENQYFWKNKLIQDYEFSDGKLELSKYVYNYLNFVTKNPDKIRQIFERYWYLSEYYEKFNYIQRIFWYVVDKGDLIIVKELLKDKRVDPSVVNNYAIRWASENGHLEVVQELLKDERVDPSDGDNYAIKWASYNGQLEIVKELLKDERVDPSALDNEAIRWARLKGHLKVVNELLKDPRVFFHGDS